MPGRPRAADGRPARARNDCAFARYQSQGPTEADDGVGLRLERRARVFSSRTGCVYVSELLLHVLRDELLLPFDAGQLAAQRHSPRGWLPKSVIRVSIGGSREQG